MQIIQFIFKLYFLLSFLIFIVGCDDSDNQPSSLSPEPAFVITNKNYKEKNEKNSINIDIQDGIICIGDNQTIAVKEPSYEKDDHSTPTDFNKESLIMANKLSPLEAFKRIKPYNNIEVNVQNGFAVVSIGNNNNISSDSSKPKKLTPEQIKEKIEELECEINKLDYLIKNLKNIEREVENIKRNIDDHINKAEEKLKSIDINDSKKDQINLALDKAKPKQTIINNLLTKIKSDIQQKADQILTIKTGFERAKIEEHHEAKKMKIVSVGQVLKRLIVDLKKEKSDLEKNKQKVENAEQAAELSALAQLL